MESDALTDLLPVPASRREGLTAVLERLLAAERIVLTTHVNADADGTGSEAAVAAWLEARGKKVTIVNPTPFPDALRFLLHRPDLAVDWGDPGAEESLRAADVVLVLDTSEANRVEPFAHLIEPGRTLVVDHHPPGPSVVGGLAVQDPTAAATGELVYDLLMLDGGAWPAASDLGMYVAIVSDTGSFRFSNTSPRTHVVAAELLQRGVDPEAVFQRLYATFPLRRFELLREALLGLRVDAELGLAWMAIPGETATRLGATHEDFDGLIDHARSVEGTEVALLFRGTPDGATKLSLRSNGTADVNRIARQFGGGGHVKAAGATLSLPMEEAVPAVLAKAREELKR